MAVIFQPAEEGGGGGLAMVEDGMMERFGIQEVYGLHNMPGLPIGEFAIRPGPLMACADEFDIVVKGRGGHAAMPEKAIDAVLIASHIIIAAQQLVSRMASPKMPSVLSFGKVVANGAINILPDEVQIEGTFRTLDEPWRKEALAKPS